MYEIKASEGDAAVGHRRNVPPGSLIGRGDRFPDWSPFLFFPPLSGRPARPATPFTSKLRSPRFAAIVRSNAGGPAIFRRA